MYKLFTDKTEIFECNVQIEGASLDKSIARIVVDSEELNLMFNGTIDKDGKFVISHEFANDLTTEGEEKFEIKVFKDKEFTEQRGNTAYVTPESTLKTKNHRF